MYDNQLVLRPGYLTSKIPQEKVERFQKFFADFSRSLAEAGYSYKAGEIFNSGYEGFTFEVERLKYVVIEQPGTVGLEDHSTGYLSVILDDNREIMLVKHRDRRFGDVRLTEAELETGYKMLAEVVQEYLNEFIDATTKERYAEGG